MLSASATDDPPYFWTINATVLLPGMRRVRRDDDGTLGCGAQRSILGSPAFRPRHVTARSNLAGYPREDTADTEADALDVPPPRPAEVLQARAPTRGAAR
ncbi:hypothetical protein GCM10009862_25730 [Microbacterium binotii]|uniref:Uncharacterized protein n=1 Tax=Microbacterium binotii TaxID=462710 RepID=A0ABN3PLW5_9MICO